MATVTLYAGACGGMDSYQPDAALDVGSGYMATGEFGSGQCNRGLLYFDVTSLGIGWTINSAQLKLTVDTNFLGTSHTLNLYRVRRRWYSSKLCNASWNHYRQGFTLDWTTAGAEDTTNDRVATPIGSVACTSATSGTQTLTIDTATVQAWVAGTYENDGILLQAGVESASSNTLIRWCGPSNATPGNRPQLVLDYTPDSKTLLTNLEAYWTLDANTYLDASGKGRTLTPHGTPTQAAGLINNATVFDPASSQYLDTANATLSGVANTDWTWVGWVKMTDNLDYYTVAGTAQTAPAYRGWQLMYHKVDVLDNYVFQIYGDQPDTCIMDCVGGAGGSPATGTWTFIACRHDSVRHYGHLFIDDHVPDSAGGHGGEQYVGADIPYYGTPLASTDNFMIGATAYYGDKRWKGMIDEVGFWSRWLSNAEIAALYNAGAGLTYPFGLSLSSLGAAQIRSAGFGHARITGGR